MSFIYQDLSVASVDASLFLSLGGDLLLGYLFGGGIHPNPWPTIPTWEVGGRISPTHLFREVLTINTPFAHAHTQDFELPVHLVVDLRDGGPGLEFLRRSDSGIRGTATLCLSQLMHHTGSGSCGVTMVLPVCFPPQPRNPSPAPRQGSDAHA